VATVAVFHHNCAKHVLALSGKDMIRIQPDGYDVLHDATSSRVFYVYGKLNIAGFDPFHKRRWGLPACKANRFYGLSPVDGPTGVNHDYHVVVVINGQLHCMNAVDDNDAPFSMPADKVLPLTKAKDGQYRVKGSSKLAYLSNIQRVFEIVDKVA
jgi:hypothetical protein